MRFKSTDNKLHFTAGTASTIKKGVKVPVEYIHYNDPLCGSFIDPRGFLVLPNFNSLSGDSTRRHALYIVNGAIVLGTEAAAITAINAFCNNIAISAIGVSITGCLVGTLANLATRQLTAIVAPTGAIQTGIWTSSAPAIATVSAGGLVTATATDGVTTITFTSTDGAFTATCVVTVA